MIRFKLPQDVNGIIRKLNESGFEAYAVGGCIRDLLLGKEPKDYDITTSAKPEDVKSLFRRTVDTGIKHGTVTVLLHDKAYEVTTYRIDGLYESHRKPLEVQFTSSLIEDLRRRDFTINAMAYNEEDGLIDEFSGAKDLENGIVRCVGEPNERFDEDALRMLRAVRFAAKLGFCLEEKTREAIKKKASFLKEVSGERIHGEMTQILVSERPHYVGMLCELGLMDFIIPEFGKNVDLSQDNPHHIYTVDQHIYETLKNVEEDARLRWTMLLHDSGKGYSKTVDEKGVGHFYGHVDISLEIAKKVLDRLRFDNNTARDILKLIKYHDYRIEPEKRQVRRAVNIIGEDLFLDYIKIRRADILGQSPRFHKEYLKKLEEVKKSFEEIVAAKECTSLKGLNINGNDLIGLGMKPGKEMGKILEELLQLVIEKPERNKKEYLLKKARKMIP